MTRRQKITIAVLVPYWIALIIVAHIPIPKLVYQAQVSDKWLHFLAYLILVFLLWFSISPDNKVNWRGGITWLIVLVAAAYGGLDELMQPYFGRTCDLLDFAANLVGILTALVMFGLFAFWQALPITLAIIIFSLTNLSKANLSNMFPVADTIFHIVAYGCFTIAWIQFMNLYLSSKTVIRLLLSLIVPLVFLLIVKAGSILLGRQFETSDLFLASLGILAAAAASYLAELHQCCKLPGAKGI